MRIFHGITGAAGQPWLLSQAEQNLGLISDYHRIENASSYYADATYRISKSDLKGQRQRRALLAKLADSYDIFNFYSRSLIMPQHPLVGTDLLQLKEMGKRIIFKFRGSEVRLETAFRNSSPYHYADDCPDLFREINEMTYMGWIKFIRDISDEIQVPDPELESYVPGSVIINRLVSRELFEVGTSEQKKEITIAHAPTNRAIKGTQDILEVMNKIKSAHSHVKFILVENMSNKEALELYKTCDILIDQLRIGWHGVLACEAMALGKAVVTYIRDDLTHSLPSPLPIENANKDTLYDSLTKLICDTDHRLALGCRAKEYALANHHPDVVAKKSVDRYEAVMLKTFEHSISPESTMWLEERRQLRKKHKRLTDRIIKKCTDFFRLAL